MPRCEKCEKELEELEKCAFCAKLFCKEDYPQHMAWERRHAGIADEEGAFWRQKHESRS